VVSLIPAKMSATPHSGATDTAVALWTVRPAAPSVQGLTEARLIAYKGADGALALLVADPVADVWREVVGAPY